MKNKNIKPGELPSKDIRLSVYLEAAERIKTGALHKGTRGFALCILLPCILWDLESPHMLSPSGQTWRLADVPFMFPELISWFEFRAKNPLSNESFNKMRLSHINKAIKKLSKVKEQVPA